MIGDGMGPEQVEAGRYYLDPTGVTPLSFESFPYQADVTTASADSAVTDSAAAATAMATGQKVNNGVISEATPGDGSSLETSLERLQKAGKMTGLVTTTYMTHATPAAFAAHESSRNNLSEIAADFLSQTKPNLLFGGGANGMTNADAVAAGYTVVTTAAEMQSLDTSSEAFVSGQFGNTHLPYEYDRIDGLPSLSEMTATALDILDNDPDGFFLMIEGGRIDHAAHNHDFARMQLEVVEFSRAAQTVVDWVMANSGWGETLVVVTADHETGGLSYEPGDSPKISWSDAGHTGINVPIYARGANAHLVTDTLENTELFTLATAISTIDPFQIVMLPDTQFYPTTAELAEIFNSQTRWVANHVTGDQLSFVTHVGDIVRSGAAEVNEWIRADAAMDLLDGQIPYSAIAGNHDFDVVQDHTTATKYIEYFGPDRYAGRTWYGGASPDQTSHYQIFTAGGREFLHLGLEWNPRPQAIAWGQSVIDAHPNLPVIFTTHNYLGLGNRNSVGTALFSSFVTANPQIFMVLCGHVGGENNRVVRNNAGLDVIEVLADYQALVNGGDGWMRLIKFLPDDDLVLFETYSPYREDINQSPFYQTDADSQFAYPLDLDARLDFTPTARLSSPWDNSPTDLEMAIDTVLVNTVQSTFEIQLSDLTDDVDDGSVVSGTVSLTRDSQPLIELTDYAFSYDVANNVITLTAVGGAFGEGEYQITLNSGQDRITDVGGLELKAKTLAVSIDTSLPSPHTETYQQGIAGYVGTSDTFLQEANPSANNASAAALTVDDDDPPGTGLDAQALLRFDSIFGEGDHQIPEGSVIVSASLTLQAFDAGNSVAVHRMRQSWSDADTWNSLDAGIQTDGIEAVETAEALTPHVTTGPLSIDVTSSLAAWVADPSSNNGWALLPTEVDTVRFDSSEGTVSPKLTVTFYPPITALQAFDDTYETLPGETLVVTAPGILVNDTGPNLTAIAATAPANGSLTLHADGAFEYTPNAEFHGFDTFTYYASNGNSQSNLATVTIFVNHTPVAIDDAFSGPEDEDVLGDVLANDSHLDIDDPLTVLLLDEPTSGTVALDPNGSFTYTPIPDFFGTDSFSYEVRDSYQSADTATVLITIQSVNDPPVAMDDLATTASGQMAVIDVLVNDADVDNADIGLFQVDEFSAEGVKVVVNPDETLSYTPPLGFVGTDSFHYWATDGIEISSVATVTITVVDAAQDAVPFEETAVYGTVIGDLSATTRSDNEYEVLQEELYAGNKKSRLEHRWTVDVAGGHTILLVVEAHRAGAGPDMFAFEYSADGVTWLPALTVTKTADDDLPQTVDLPTTLSGSVFVRVIDTDATPKEVAPDQLFVDQLIVRSISGPPNDAPVAEADGYTTLEDQSLSVDAPGVLVNDFDPEGSQLTAILVTAAANGALTLSADGSFMYMPSADFNGTDTFTYAVSDGLLQSSPVTVTITVDPVNDAPIAEHLSVSTTQNVTLPIALLASDVDGDSVLFSITSGPTHGTLSGTTSDLTYTPNPDFVGTDVFEYVADDGTVSSSPATVTIAVQPTSSGTKFFVVDAGTPQTFEYASDFQVLAGNEWPVATNPRGLASNLAGTRLWVIDNLGTVFVHDGDGALLGSWHADGAISPEGIASNGVDIWIVDSGSKKLLHYENAATVLDAGGIRPSTRAGLGAKASPMGITTDGSKLWIVDNLAGEIQEYSLGLTLVASWPLDAANASPTGITIDAETPGVLWVVDDAADAVFRYVLGESGLVYDTQKPLASSNDQPQGIADPLPGADRQTTDADASTVFAAYPLGVDITDLPLITDREASVWHATAPSGGVVSDQHRVRQALDLPRSHVDAAFACFDTCSTPLPASLKDFAWAEDALDDELLTTLAGEAF